MERRARPRPNPFAQTKSRQLVDALALRYGRLPTEILALPLEEIYLNYHIAFPKAEEMREVASLMREREKALGYSPTKRLLEELKGRGRGIKG